MRFFSGFGIILVLLTLFSRNAWAAELPEASCGDSKLIISNLPEDDRRVSVRINDKANGWNLENPFPGDFADTISSDKGKYTFSAQDKHTYDWWVHIENADGTFGSAIGGAVYCGAAAPENLKASCRDNQLSISWNKVSSADHYAIRVDDTSNTWDDKKLQTGDRADNSVKDPKYTLQATTGHGYNVWVHAVDAKGIFSPAAETFVSCRRSGGTFFDSIIAFFKGLLP